MRRSQIKLILTACQMSFEGKTDEEIADYVGLHVSAVSRWRKSSAWKEFEQELIDAHKQSLLASYDRPAATLSEG